MKKFITVAAVLSVCCQMICAQGINQIWGITQNGGSDDIGVIFNTNAYADNFQLRHNLNYKYPGRNPSYNDVVEYNGKLYGMTRLGGKNDIGMIFEWDPVTNVYTKKIDFGTNGAVPEGSLTLFAGKFYGMTNLGGINGAGVIFEWNPATNVYTKQIDLSTANGSRPYGNLVMYGGKFYGMTLYGGVNDKGVIFEWDPVTNIYSKKIDLSTTLGSNPSGSLTLNAGKFYGLTQNGGSNNEGVIFEWDPVTNVYSKKIDLILATGRTPWGSLVYYAGKFYGMTASGGSNSVGVIFEWDPVTNVYTKRIDFSFANGCNPIGSLALSNGKFYGTVSNCGANSAGVIFEWDPLTNVYTKEFDLNIADGRWPYGSLTLSSGKFYGMTQSGGINGQGVIFEWDSVTKIYTKKIDLLYSNGRWSQGGLTSIGRKLYGMTNDGGINTQGVMFEWDLDSAAYTKKIDLNNATGYSPTGNNVVQFGTKLYGTQRLGGIFGWGTIFEWDPATNSYTKKFDFGTTNGTEPWGGMVLYNNKFYGVTRQGGSGQGVIYEWDPVTNVFTKKVNFNGAIGCYSYGGFMQYAGKFYGMSYECGANGAGTIYEWDPVTNIAAAKISFNTTNGRNPHGNLTEYGGKLYGMTYGGGANSAGTIFEWDPVTNTHTVRVNLINATGSRPYGTLLLNNGKFYGMTSDGGANFMGVLFEWDPVTNIYTVKKNFTGTDGKTPMYGNGLTIVQAPVAKGNLVSCEALAAITIDATNNNTWVPIVDNLGDIAAEINANGNNLGIVNTSLYTKNGACREDGSNRLYLNRNITITPQTQPGSGNVSVRIYIKKSELDSLRTAMNSMGQPSGVASINEVDVFKNNDACSTIGSLTALPLTATTGTYNSDYYLQVSISSFSSFYFANKLLTAILPVKITSFSGKRTGAVNELKWEASCNSSVLFYVERSKDGIHFEAIGNVSAADCRTPFYFTDNTPFSKNNYYRLRFIETGATLKYSAVILLNTDKANPLQISLQPNLVKGSSINIELNADKNQFLELLITDVTGRMMLKKQLTVQEGSNREPVNISTLTPGIYWLYAVAKDGRSNVLRFVKQ